MRHLRNQCKGTIQPFDRWQDQFARLGLNTKALCLGAGFRKDSLGLDYAYMGNRDETFDATHRFSVSLGFGQNQP